MPGTYSSLYRRLHHIEKWLTISNLIQRKKLECLFSPTSLGAQLLLHSVLVRWAHLSIYDAGVQCLICGGAGAKAWSRRDMNSVDCAKITIMNITGAAMSVQQRNNVQVAGEGPVTMVFAHGFGCDLNMWRFFAPSFQDRYRTVLFDLVGGGKSDLSAYDRKKYGSLHGYAADVLDIVDEFADSAVIYVGHSVSAMIGMLAAIERPDCFAANVMIGPSPSFIDDGEYVGGFTRADIEELLEALESNYLGWSSTMAPAIMGSPEHPDLAQELTNSFCRTDPEIAKHFARATFMADHRAELLRVTTPTLIVQSNDDLLAPMTVGEYMNSKIAGSTLSIVENVGHCPHLSAPGASKEATEDFLRRLEL